MITLDNPSVSSVATPVVMIAAALNKMTFSLVMSIKSLITTTAPLRALLMVNQVAKENK